MTFLARGTLYPIHWVFLVHNTLDECALNFFLPPTLALFSFLSILEASASVRLISLAWILLLLREVLFYVLRCHTFSLRHLHSGDLQGHHLHVQRADTTTHASTAPRPSYRAMLARPESSTSAAIPFQPPVCLVRMELAGRLRLLFRLSSDRAFQEHNRASFRVIFTRARFRCGLYYAPRLGDRCGFIVYWSSPLPCALV